MGLGRPAGKVIEVSVRFKRGAKEELEATPGTLRRQNSQPWRHGVRGRGRQNSRAWESASGDCGGGGGGGTGVAAAEGNGNLPPAQVLRVTL